MIFNEVCLLGAAILLFWVNDSSVNNQKIAPTVYILLVLFNFVINIIRSFFDLFEICGKGRKYRV
jgi:hypothetical protein